MLRMLQVLEWIVLVTLGVTNTGSVSPPGESLQDVLGRTLKVPKEGFHRVIPMTPSLAEDLVWLEVWDRVAGIVRYAKDIPELAHKPVIGDPMFPNIETIARLEPDLVILNRGLNPKTIADELNQLGIPYFVMEESSFEDLEKNLKTFGRMFHREARVRSWLTRWRELHGCLSTLHWGIRPRVLFIVSQEPIFVTGKTAFITDVLTLSGLHVVSDEIPRPWPQVSLEQVARWVPEILLIPGTPNDYQRSSLLSNPAWQSVPAVKNRRVDFIDSGVLRLSPNLANMILRLARKYHPDHVALQACARRFLNKGEWP